MCRVGIICPTMNRECAAVITRTGNSVFEPSSSGIFFGGNHRSHCAASPGNQVSRSDGSTGRAQAAAGGRCRGTSVIDPVQPTRSAITVAGMSGVVLSSARTSGSNGVNDVGTARSLVLRWPVRGQRPLDRRPTDTQIPCDLPLRNTVRNQPPDQRPILHRDHPSNLSGWPRFRPSLWPRFQASSTSRSGHRAGHAGRGVPQSTIRVASRMRFLFRDKWIRPVHAVPGAGGLTRALRPLVDGRWRLTGFPFTNGAFGNSTEGAGAICSSAVGALRPTMPLCGRSCRCGVVTAGVAGPR